MPANLITLPHFSVSSTISLPNWTDDPGSGVPPRSARRALILGSASAHVNFLVQLLHDVSWRVPGGTDASPVDSTRSPARIQPPWEFLAALASASRLSPPAHEVCRP